MLRIRELTAAEIPILKDFAPREWNSDLPALFGRHFGQPYFYPIVAELDGTVVGCASALVNGEAGWLGNIIVLPGSRGHGIGSALTSQLVEFFHTHNVTSQILVATRMGEPVYRKLGFEIVLHYLFFSKQEVATVPNADAAVRPLESEDHEAVFDLDLSITAESRQDFLALFFDDAWVHVSAFGKPDGYYLPRLSNGPVIASNDDAGLALMRLKISRGTQTCVVPEGNPVAVGFLLSQGFAVTSRAPRMALGPDVNWQPQHMYCRGSGYCG